MPLVFWIEYVDAAPLVIGLALVLPTPHRDPAPVR
jgi:hypothetical protein